MDVRWVMLAATAAAGFAAAVVPALGRDEAIHTGPGNAFTPPTVTIAPGEKVTISNAAGGFHTLVWDDGTPTNTQAGSAWSERRTFDAAGSYGFYCSIPGDSGGQGMSGTVVVKAAPPSTPSTGTTQTQTTTTETQTQTQTQTTPAQTETTSAPSETPTTVAPTQTRDVRAPRLRVRASGVVRKLQL